MVVENRYGKVLKFPVQLLWISIMSLGLISCARVSSYPVSLQYIPQQDISDRDMAPVNAVIGVADFQDNRSFDDKAVVGKRLMSKGEEIDIKCQLKDANHAVISVIKEFIKRSGYTVGKDISDWDLNADSLPPECGEFAIGGSIEELQIVCQGGLFREKYEVKVRLSIVFADVQQKRILYQSTLESSSQLKNIRFSQENVQEELNNVLSSVVEKILDIDIINQAL